MSPVSQAPSQLSWQRWPWRVPIYTRVMLGEYLWHIQAVFLATLGVVTAINISSEIAIVWAEGLVDGAFSAVSRAGHYVFLRLLDNGSQVFPAALVLGIAWTEIAHTQSGRRTMVRTAGISLPRASIALIMVVVASIPIQFLLDNVVRPHAFMSLSVNGLGEYGWSYSRMRAERTEWLSFGNDILQVQMEDAPQPILSRATHYRFSAEGELVLLSDAPSMVRHGEGGREAWQLVEGRQWALLPPKRIVTREDGERTTRLVGRGDVDLDLALDPLWLEYRHIPAKYIPLGDLVALSQQASLPDNSPKYHEWLHIRAAQAFNPGLVGLLIALVFVVFVDRFGLIRAGAFMVAAGYAGLTLTRVMAIVAEHQVLPLPLTVWMPPFLFLGAALALFQFVWFRNRRFEAPSVPVRSSV